MGLLEGLFGGDRHGHSRGRANKASGMAADAPTPSSGAIPPLSSAAASVVRRCARIAGVPVDQLLRRFDGEEQASRPLAYARSVVEYCSYIALRVETRRQDHLGDREFHSLTYDMMLAWEAPDEDTDAMFQKTAFSILHDDEDDDGGGSIFYSSPTQMAIQVDGRRTVGPEAFAKITPACPAIAHPITVRNLFDALTNSTGGRLHFLIYHKYLKKLDQVLSLAKSISGGHRAPDLELSDGEIILDIYGTTTTKPVLQHIGTSTWPGRLTLTNHALYFEAIGVDFSYGEAAVYDLARDLKQSVKQKLPKGDKILEAMYSQLKQHCPRFGGSQNPGQSNSDKLTLVDPFPLSAYTMVTMGLLTLKKEDNPEERDFAARDVQIGGTSSMQMALERSVGYSGRVEAARATLDQVKLEDIDTNVAVLKELLYPLIEIGKSLLALTEWDEPFKSYVFLLCFLYMVYSGWIWFVFPGFLLGSTIFMLWNKHYGNMQSIGAFEIITPPPRRTVEQLLALQEAISQVEAHVQAGNIFLLKLRSLMLAAFPQSTNKVAGALVVAAMAFMLMPLRTIVLLILLEVYTRQMPVRKKSSEKLVRRLREWWLRIPAAPVQLLKPQDTTRRWRSRLRSR